MKKINKLVFVAPKISGGGAERVVSVLSSSLAELNYQVDLILYERKEDEYPLSSKVNVHLLPGRKKGQSKVNYLLNKYLYLRNLLKKIRPDVLIPFLPYQVEQCYAASIGLGIPFVVTVRNNPQFDTPNEKMRKRRDWIAKHADAVFLQTESQKDYFDNDIAINSFVLPNPVNDEVLKSEYNYSDRITRLISIGRLEEQKNFKMLIDAVILCNERGANISLDIFGEGSLREQLNDYIKNKEATKYIVLKGRTSNVVETLKQYDLFIMSSLYEGMPNALMEAMGVGIPCISTDCPTGPAELIGKDERGILVKKNTSEEIADSIIMAINDVDGAKKRAIEAKKYIARYYSANKISRQLIDELSNLI